ncbi:hypothetical protein NP493_473g00021 [Ridgeia piscesae]|uniref:LicD/FKTN/FKRP nucleotidyltransferase domain-containing protein n=1 Tax=Ridgeia piscesae TaxID=27915 RepID=A0AAD9KYJ9_RIDPI|nr:hypothetical protein NP493_473g00021 [Ridgeia piscesae]
MVVFRKVRTLTYIFVSIFVLCVLYISCKRVPTDRITETKPVKIMTTMSAESVVPRAVRSAELSSVHSAFNMPSKRLHADQPFMPVTSTETNPASTTVKLSPRPAVSTLLHPTSISVRSASNISSKNLHADQPAKQMITTASTRVKATTGPSVSVIPRGLRPVMSVADHANLMSVLRRFTEAADAANITYFMYGGTLLGSYRHHGQTPWDDDADLFVSSRQKPQLQKMLRSLAPRFRFAKSAYTEWKVFTRYSKTIPTVPWKFPFLDVSFYGVNQKVLWDEAPGQNRINTFRKSDIFPLCRRPFAGMMLPAPRNTLAVLKQYKLDECVSSNYNHSIEDFIPAADRRSLPCRALWGTVPFVFRTKTSHGTNETLKIGSKVLSWFIPKC